MRLWSIHPQHLDSKGLVALWREALLAQHVLDQKTTGYRSHPQLIRFRNAKKPLDAINQYLSAVYAEAEKRNYHFDKSKIDWNFEEATIEVTDGIYLQCMPKRKKGIIISINQKLIGILKKQPLKLPMAN